MLEIFQYIGVITVGAGAVATFAYWLFKLFSEKWLTAKFDKHLEDHKHAQQKELENVRFEFNKLMDRTVKLHQQEFDVLPEAWALLVVAKGMSESAVSYLQSYIDLSQMSDAQLDQYLVKCPFDQWKKEEIKSSSEKNKLYQKYMDWEKIVNAQASFREFSLFRLKNGIFMSSPIQEKFRQLDNLIIEALIERQIELEPGSDSPGKDARKKFKKECGNLMDNLEVAIHDRLWSNQAQEDQP